MANIIIQLGSFSEQLLLNAETICVVFVNYCPRESGPSEWEIDARKTCRDTGDNVRSNLKCTENIVKYKLEGRVFVQICSFAGLVMCCNMIMILMPAFKLAMKRMVCHLIYDADVSRQCCRYKSPHVGRCPCRGYWQICNIIRILLCDFLVWRFKSHSSNFSKSAWDPLRICCDAHPKGCLVGYLL